MTKDEALKLALEALENAVRYHGIMLMSDPPQDAWKYHKVEDKAGKAITAIKEALAQPEREPVAHPVIAGALFDFMGWLTSRKERICLSSANEASPAVDAIRDFAKMRGLSLDDAKVQDWNTTPPQRKPLTDEQIDEEFKLYASKFDTSSDKWLDMGADDYFKAGFKAAHGIKENKHDKR